jgi:hypothetical protein
MLQHMLHLPCSSGMWEASVVPEACRSSPRVVVVVVLLPCLNFQNIIPSSNGNEGDPAHPLAQTQAACDLEPAWRVVVLPALPEHVWHSLLAVPSGMVPPRPKVPMGHSSQVGPPREQQRPCAEGAVSDVLGTHSFRFGLWGSA